MHSTQFTAATPKYRGKKVVVVGAGNSAHDIAHEAYLHGADVTIIQRSSTYVISLYSTLLTMMTRYHEGVVSDIIFIISERYLTQITNDIVDRRCRFR